MKRSKPSTHEASRADSQPATVAAADGAPELKRTVVPIAAIPGARPQRKATSTLTPEHAREIVAALTEPMIIAKLRPQLSFASSGPGLSAFLRVLARHGYVRVNPKAGQLPNGAAVALYQATGKPITVADLPAVKTTRKPRVLTLPRPRVPSREEAGVFNVMRIAVKSGSQITLTLGGVRLVITAEA